MKYLALVIVFFFSLQTNAEEVWKPFGIELGKELPKNIKVIKKFNEHNWPSKFSGTKQFSYFNDFYKIANGQFIALDKEDPTFKDIIVFTTKKSKQIIRIYTEVDYQREYQCRATMNEIIRIALSKGYEGDSYWSVGGVLIEFGSEPLQMMDTWATWNSNSQKNFQVSLDCLKIEYNKWELAFDFKLNPDYWEDKPKQDSNWPSDLSGLN
ncbi:MAG: hypothetical protein CMI98_03275 [Pelagibacteraceae bacterium]|nr:hypothetical protein [Pelagibacteraceae bacterium]|tara:strand:+ start:4776 stop:5405 length:630 start_codon:yes stop_codon:yes gene_type:complete